MTRSQTMFRTALLDPAKPVPDGLTDGADHPAGARFNVYRNNVAVSLTEALHVAFPVIAKLLGRENMDGLAGLFLRAHPPSSPLMMHYGAALPDFIAGLGQLSHLGYLPDVARLELALRQSYHAADSTGIDPAVLGALSADALLCMGITLTPATVLVRSDWPIHDIWRFNTQDDAPKPAPVAQDVLITRPDFDPVPNLLSDGSADWIATLQQGASIATALQTAQTGTPEFDLTTPLTLLLAGKAIASLDEKG